jgi:hypothetical protein
MKKQIVFVFLTHFLSKQGITFEQFKHFFSFLNNLEEFSIAMRFHQLSNKPISQGKNLFPEE